MNTNRVEQLMQRNVATCHPGDPLNVAARIMWERDCGVVPVTVDEEGGARVVGIMTDRDACMAAYTKGRPLCEIPVSAAMSHEVRACGPKDPIGTVLKIMATGQIHRLPVLDDAGHLVGIISLADLAREEARSHRMVTAGDLAATLEAISVPRPGDLVVAA
jgi:CBS domain-containing protein